MNFPLNKILSDTYNKGIEDGTNAAGLDLKAYHFRVDFLFASTSTGWSGFGLGMLSLMSGGAKGMLADAAGIEFDMRFQTISGMSYEHDTVEYKEGGNTNMRQVFYKGTTYDNLILKRGVILAGSTISSDFRQNLNRFFSIRKNILISLLSDWGIPVCSWLVYNAKPKKWSLDELNAESNSIAIETMEFTYSHFKRIAIDSIFSEY